MNETDRNLCVQIKEDLERKKDLPCRVELFSGENPPEENAVWEKVRKNEEEKNGNLQDEFLTFYRQTEPELIAVLRGSAAAALCRERGYRSVCSLLLDTLDRLFPPDMVPMITDMKEYQKVKNRLVIRPFNAEDDAASLARTIWRQVGDIALCVCIRIAGEKEAAAKISEKALEIWDKSSQEVFQDAMENTMEANPAVLYAGCPEAGKVITVFDGSGNTPSGNIPGAVFLSGKSMEGGAAAAFYPETGGKIAAFLGCGYYLVFLSREEARIFPACDSPKGLAGFLAAVNRQESPGKKLLTRMIFRYDERRNAVVPVEQTRPDGASYLV